MRRILFEIPNAQMLAWIGAALAILFALYHAFKPPRKDEQGNREPFPVGSVLGGIAVAAVLVWGVALNDTFREDAVRLAGGKTVTGKIVEKTGREVTLATLGGRQTIPLARVADVEKDRPRGIPIYSYGFMMMVAFAMAIYVAAVRARNAGLDPNIILDLGLWCMISGIVGARLFHVIQFHEQFRNKSFFEFFKVWEGGIVFYGGLIGAFSAGVFFLYKKGISIRRMMDIVAPSVPLGVAFARFGCFLNGCCFGRTTDASFPLAVRYGPGSHALYRHIHDLHYLKEGATRSLPVHPTQLYSSFNGFLLFVLLSLYFAWTRKRRVRGEVFLLFGILYPIGRFILESFREDTDPVLGPLTISQTLSLLILAVSVPLFAWAQIAKLRGAQEEETRDIGNGK